MSNRIDRSYFLLLTLLVNVNAVYSSYNPFCIFALTEKESL